MATTLKVRYEYSDGSENHVRRRYLFYPNDRIVQYGYTPGTDDALSRVSLLANFMVSNSEPCLVWYQYLGGSPRPQGGRGAGGGLLKTLRCWQ